MEIVPSAERVQVSVGRKVNGVEQLILNVNIYKGTRLKHGYNFITIQHNWSDIMLAVE